MSNKKERGVVITGVGPLTAIGFGKDQLWKAILEKKTALAEEKFFLDGKPWDSFLLHKIRDFDIAKFKIEKTVIEDIKSWKNGTEDRDLLYLLAAVKLALDDSKISYDRENNNIGLFLTIEHPGFEHFCEEIALSYLNKKFPDLKVLSKEEAFHHLYEMFVQKGYDLQTFMYLFFVAKVFGIHGYSLFTNNACASGLFAIESAARQIKAGGSEITIVAGGDYPCTMFKHLWFKERNLYAEDGKIKPFSKNADGIVFGDGASALVLEELKHAVKRGAHIYAEYLGGGFSLEGWKVTMPQVGGLSYQKAIKAALENTQLSPENIDLINPHGVGIKITDAYEARAINDIFKIKKPFISAFKPYIGHNLGGSALIETVILLLAMEKNLIPSTLNCQDINPKYKIELVKKSTNSQLKTTMKLSCGFAGYNGAAIFRKYG